MFWLSKKVCPTGPDTPSPWIFHSPLCHWKIPLQHGTILNHAFHKVQPLSFQPENDDGTRDRKDFALRAGRFGVVFGQVCKAEQLKQYGTSFKI